MRCIITYRNITAHPLRFALLIEMKVESKLKMPPGMRRQDHDKVHRLEAGDTCDPGQERSLAFDWAWHGHPLDYVIRAAEGLSCKFQYRRFLVDGRPVVGSRTGEIGADGFIPLTEGLIL